METIEAYSVRKKKELDLLNSFLGEPLTIRSPRSVAEVIEQKFHLAAALKAKHVLHDWALTETAWTQSHRPRLGPFQFKYDYQRADLEVRGPSFYGFEDQSDSQTVYTGSGMAAISALLMAMASVFPEADIVTMPNSYGETAELIDGHAKHLRRIELGRSLAEITGFRGSRPRVLLLDSCTSAGAFEAIVKCAQPRLDLVVFDTSCFCSGSGHVLRALNWARDTTIPIVLLRSHTKLDSLGVEYGRLGSAVFAHCPHAVGAKQRLLQALLTETQNAVRLFGGAALPAHFPPYVGTPAYRSLTNKRVAAMLRNNRRARRHFSAALAGSSAEFHFAHGLYVTLASARTLDENEARDVVAELCADLDRRGLPLRHAGSFGFDFGAAEWSRDRIRDRYVVRIAAADLPTSLWDEVIAAVAVWWKAHEGQAKRSVQNVGKDKEATSVPSTGSCDTISPYNGRLGRGCKLARQFWVSAPLAGRSAYSPMGAPHGGPACLGWTVAAARKGRRLGAGLYDLDFFCFVGLLDRRRHFCHRHQGSRHLVQQLVGIFLFCQ